MYAARNPNYTLYALLLESDVWSSDVLVASLPVLISLLGALLLPSPILA